MQNIRMSRVDSEIQKAVASIIDAKVRDENLGCMITVQSVKTTPDLLLSTVGVTVLGADENQILRYLNSIKKTIRKELAGQVRLKILPDLNFVLDKFYDYSIHMDELFKSIEEGDKK